MEPILAVPLPGATTLQSYVGMDEAAQRLYDTLYKNLIVTIIMTKNCGYSSLSKWLSQNQMSSGGQVYPIKSNDLVEMMNSKTFGHDPFKPKNSKRGNQKKKKKKDDKDDETAGLKED